MAAITLQTLRIEGSGIQAQPRARGSASFAVKAINGETRLADLRHAGSMKVLFPRIARGPFQATLINTAGGVTGGDRFDVCADVGADAAVTITTQASERAYCAVSGETGTLHTRLSVADGGHLNWLPQETILFDGCNFRRSLTLDLKAKATALVVEPLVFGRLAMGETLSRAEFHDRIEITRDGHPIYLDAIRLEGDIAARLNRPMVGAGAAAMATLIYIAPKAEALLAPLRDALPEHAGASLMGEDILVLRMLAPDSFALRRSLVPILNRLTHNQLPKVWMI